MGCDIHLFPEYKVDNGTWQAHPNIIVKIENEGTDHEYTYINYDEGIGRNYELFADMAGVRGDGPEPKGIPYGVSSIIKKVIEQWKGDAHSHSYMPLNELKKLMKKHGYDVKSNEMFTSCQTISKELSQIDKILLNGPKSIVEHRVVFFFDS